MRHAFALAAVLVCFGGLSSAVAQPRLLEAMHWKFHGPVASIEEQEYAYDYKTKTLAAEPEKNRTYRFDAEGALEAVDETDPYGKTTFTFGYYDGGRMKSLRRFRIVASGKTFEDEQACQRDEQGKIAGLTFEEFSGIVSIRLKQRVENTAADGHRQIKTFDPEEDGGRAKRLYFVAPDGLLAIYFYDGFSEPERVSKMELYNAKGLLAETRSLNDTDDPKKVTSRETYEYEFDSQGNWITRTTHSAIGDNPSKINRRLTRTVKYRQQ